MGGRLGGGVGEEQREEEGGSPGGGGEGGESDGEGKGAEEEGVGKGGGDRDGHGGRAGYRDRAGVMAYLFEGIPPDHVNKRTPKARFDDVFWTRHAAEKSAELPVELLSDYVDPDAVRALWASDKPKSNTALIAKYLYERVALGHGAAMGRSEH